MNKYQLLTMLIVVFGIAGCEQSSKGFSLPVGDPVKGEQVFLTLECLSCHQMDGYERPANANEELAVKLGGKVDSLKTYAELVTSVINPSHQLAEGYDLSKIQVDGQSVMPSFNDVLTVTDLVNLITFLESRYELEPYPKTEYMIYR
ncbi:c-type cytochrome [Photobacterium sp. MCCC 1A19761]|uniref:c-type cytochrome n=1 Tax=Photobacterium sp. MCCC 1A19761 TaxID=3115000 RepID=UPI00307CD8D9